MWGVGEVGVWSELDLMLVQALQMHEDGLCSGCGQPLMHTSDMDNIWAFELDSVSCHACEFLENARKTEAKPGVKTYIQNLMSRMWLGKR